MIFQDPMSSLNPRIRRRREFGEAPRVHGMTDAAGQKDYVAELFRRVGLDPDYIRRYPHQFSGGQRARIGIARALAVKPKLLICDESVAALDVSIQAQVLNLFMDLRQDLGLAYLFISHDLGVVRHISDRILIMYLGRVIESGPTKAIFRRPHPPPIPAHCSTTCRNSRRRALLRIDQGGIPSPINPPPGLPFPSALPACGPALQPREAEGNIALWRADGLLPSAGWRRTITPSASRNRRCDRALRRGGEATIEQIAVTVSP